MRAARLPDDQRHIARYALCTVIDEAIQMTPWGGTANWAQQSLLIHFFREAGAARSSSRS